LTEMSIPERVAIQEQVERILQSDALHGSEVLRRLLKFLADKSVAGESNNLKEYSIATDGLGKHFSYDPCHSSAVRLQVRRLREKLADYYRDEGLKDPVVIDLPKGRFKLRFEYRPCAVTVPSQIEVPLQPVPAAEMQTPPSIPQGPVRSLIGRLPRLAFSLGAVLTVALAIGEYQQFKTANAKGTSISFPPGWDADMEDLWRPFITADRPLILAIEDPLFVELNGDTGIYYRDKTLNTWKDVKSSHKVGALSNALKITHIQPSRYYTAFGEVDSAFLIEKLLGPREQDISVVKTSDLSFRQLANDNVLFVGVQNLFFDEQAKAMPTEAQFQPVKEGIRNLHPGPNEPHLFADKYSTAPSEEGVAYALVTHFPGPLGGNDVESFTSSRSAGYVAAVKTFTDPVCARELVSNLRKSNGGRVPRYFQVLLKVTFKDEVPTEVTYVLGRELKTGK
jgi:hypothetical protein